MSNEVRNVVTIVFVFIVLLTAVAAVAANLGLFGLDPNSAFAKVTLGAVLVEIVTAVLLVWRSGGLMPSVASAVIAFEGEEDPKGVDLDLDAEDCTYRVTDMRAKVKETGKVGLVYGNAGWECKFPSPKELDVSVTLRLVEKSGKAWEVRPFYPLSRDVKARVVK
jgi:hypothetical protein